MEGVRLVSSCLAAAVYTRHYHRNRIQELRREAADEKTDTISTLNDPIALPHEILLIADIGNIACSLAIIESKQIRRGKTDIVRGKPPFFCPAPPLPLSLSHSFTFHTQHTKTHTHKQKCTE